MLWKGFQRPKRVDIEAETLTGTYGKFSAQPFERGFATTVGNALRRCLLSSIEGAAITSVQIEGVLHEFSSIPGVQEDVTNVVLNLKQIPVTPAQRGREDPDHRRQGTPRRQGGRPRRRSVGRDLRSERPHRDGQRRRPAPPAGPDPARPRLRDRGQELRRGARARLDSARLGAQPRQAGQLPRRGRARSDGSPTTRS